MLFVVRILALVVAYVTGVFGGIGAALDTLSFSGRIKALFVCASVLRCVGEFVNVASLGNTLKQSK